MMGLLHLAQTLRRVSSTICKWKLDLKRVEMLVRAIDTEHSVGSHLRSFKTNTLSAFKTSSKSLGTPLRRLRHFSTRTRTWKDSYFVSSARSRPPMSQLQ